MTATRRLAAIVVADVVGYSRLMEADEAGTLAALKERRKMILEPEVKAHGGRIVKLMGDGVLIEFASAVNAVNAALKLHEKFAAANESLGEDRRILLRNGINLGDVIGEGSDIYGDGVNIAARLEALAEPGALCISGKVHEEIRGKIDITMEDMGHVELKNLTHPIRAYRSAAGPGTGQRAAKPKRIEKPSIAILPFDNMSGDPEQQYFSDGITEDIITAVSCFRSLFVIARNSSFAFRGQPLTIPEIARRLSVGYVLEGSVRRSGSRVRISAQLIEAASGNHVWSGRYDRSLEDVFAVQDEIARMIASTLAEQIIDDIANRAARRHPENYAAYDYSLRGLQLQQRQTRQDVAEAIPYLEKAIELDPNYAEAHSWLALCHLFYWTYDCNGIGLEKALEFARRGVSLDSNNARCHVIAGVCALCNRQFEESEFHHIRAMALNPNDAHVTMHMGLFLAYTGRSGESRSWFDKGRLLNPYPPVWYPQFERVAAYAARRYADAAIAVQGTSEDTIDMMYVSASLGQLGRLREARASLEICQRLKPDISLLVFAETEPYRNRSDTEHLIEGLRKAGLPE